jgi:hypothetical protein
VRGDKLECLRFSLSLFTRNLSLFACLTGCKSSPDDWVDSLFMFRSMLRDRR